MSFGEILLMMFSAILVENFIFAKFYGCCPFLGVSDKPDTALGMGLAVTFVMTLSGAATYAVYHFILLPLGLTYLKTVAFILVIAALVQFIEMFCGALFPRFTGHWASICRLLPPTAPCFRPRSLRCRTITASALRWLSVLPRLLDLRWPLWFLPASAKNGFCRAAPRFPRISHHADRGRTSGHGFCRICRRAPVKGGGK